MELVTLMVFCRINAEGTMDELVSVPQEKRGDVEEAFTDIEKRESRSSKLMAEIDSRDLE